MTMMMMPCIAFARYIFWAKELTVGTLDTSSSVIQYNLNKFASVNDIHFYMSTDDNVDWYALSLVFNIEEDVPVYLHKTSPRTPWHLDRIGKRSLPLDGNFAFGKHGSCHRNASLDINTYIVDTGIDVSHEQFEGRAQWGANFADTIDTDCNNHGTHVAALSGGKDYGVCVDAKLYAVKVLSCDGSGMLSGVIKGIEWAFNHHQQVNGSAKGIINLSLGGGYSAALNAAVESSMNDPSFYVVVAAGNENQDACNTSPAGAKNVLTVMASDRFDSRAYFSNWGHCGDIYAPGVAILSAIPNGKTAEYSGTSMSSPIVVGALNHYVDACPECTNKQVIRNMLKAATRNTISNNNPETRNTLVYLERP